MRALGSCIFAQFFFLASLTVSPDALATLASETTSDEVILSDESDNINDPIEPVNRAVMAFNEVVDGLIFGPLTEIYTIMVPDPAKEKVHNVLSNLTVPYTFVNDVLQGEGVRAKESAIRFSINSTIGLGGLFDVAKSHGNIQPHSEDFGQTLAVWGADEGFYLVLPFFGPSTLRDSIGLGLGIFLDPMNYALSHAGHPDWTYTRAGLTAMDRRARSSSIFEYIYGSASPYETGKSLYLQNRRFEIGNGQESTDYDAPTPDFT